jgi:hypothetical protein
MGPGFGLAPHGSPDNKAWTTICIGIGSMGLIEDVGSLMQHFPVIGAAS